MQPIFNFGTNIDCDYAEQQITDIITADAAAVRTLFTNYSRTACKSEFDAAGNVYPYIEICGDFYNASNYNGVPIKNTAIKLINAVIFNQSNSLNPNCPSGQFKGYNFSSGIGPANPQDDNATYCASGAYQMNCADKSVPNTPTPPSPPAPPPRPPAPPSPTVIMVRLLRFRRLGFRSCTLACHHSTCHVSD